MRTVADACVQIGRAVNMRSDVQPALVAVALVHDFPDVDRGARADRSMIDHALGDAASAVAAFHRPSSHSAAARSAGGPIYTRPLSLGWQSPVVRESVRLCVTFTLATALGMWLLDYRSSWVPFTVALVTQPGYVSAINRALLRLAGTLVGIGLSAVLVELVPQRGWWMAVIAAGSAFAIYSLAPANYGAAVVFITVFALMPLDFLHGPIGEALLFRGLATLLGGMIVIIGAMIAPRRSAPKLAPRLADYADAVHRSIALVLVDAKMHDHTDALKSGHGVQSAVVATLDQAWAEPPGHGLDARIGQHVYRRLNVVALYRADLADGVVPRDTVEPQAALDGLHQIAARLRAVDARGIVPSRSAADKLVAATGPATAALLAAQEELDRGEVQTQVR